MLFFFAGHMGSSTVRIRTFLNYHVPYTAARNEPGASALLGTRFLTVALHLVLYIVYGRGRPACRLRGVHRMAYTDIGHGAVVLSATVELLTCARVRDATHIAV